MASSPTAALLTAIAFAADRHRDQRRKDAAASPYINHPIALALLLSQNGIDDLVVLQAAILHDTIEDTETTYEDIVERFGQEVADVVMEVTDDKSLQKAQRKQAQVDHAPHKSRAAALVKLADKTSNLRDVASSPPKDWSLERRREYFDWAKQVVDGLPKVDVGMEQAFEEAWRARP
jgi:guanosine-3',5'-bis(diphosphate) 3'-pyrophosphohydrolase